MGWRRIGVEEGLGAGGWGLVETGRPGMGVQRWSDLRTSPQEKCRRDGGEAKQDDADPERIRLIAKLDRVPSGGDAHGAEHDVGRKNRNGLAVHERLPPWIVGVGDDDQPVGGEVRLEQQPIGVARIGDASGLIGTSP
jgi:hypothetical protein